MSPTDGIPRSQFHLNLPEDLHQQLRGRAAREARSINSLIIWLLRRQLDTDETAASPMLIMNPAREDR